MQGSTRESERIHEVRRIFQEYGFGNAELLEGWDGVDPDQLADLLSEEEFQTLLDELQAREGPDR